MGSGKSTLAKRIVDKIPQFTYIDVDVFRRDLIQNNDLFKTELLGKLNLKDINQLNDLIYNDNNAMILFKKILHNYLSNYIQSKKEPLIVDYALLIDDNLLNGLDKVIILKCDLDKAISRVSGGDLPIDTIKKRINLQLSFEDKVKIISNLNIKYLIVDNNHEMDLSKVIDFINGDN